MTRRDVGGCEEQFERSPGITGRPCFHPNQFVNLEAEPPKDMLLFSASGDAEKHRARAVVNRTKAFLIRVISSKPVKRYFLWYESGSIQIVARGRAYYPLKWTSSEAYATKSVLVVITKSDTKAH
ncbi:hypothetical protein FGIG_11082 [Fasciola gigantica]|uniref:Uncharacterized protein n=1 Tax=Fasciola gigantica TaxID=46835 RepID=A0A504YKS7_FASGI|nr:hypothetical protein FGIG_11082 [Fasciola gigantica]